MKILEKLRTTIHAKADYPSDGKHVLVKTRNILDIIQI